MSCYQVFIKFEETSRKFATVNITHISICRAKTKLSYNYAWSSFKHKSF